jgi:putative membrane protein
MRYISKVSLTATFVAVLTVCGLAAQQNTDMTGSSAMKAADATKPSAGTAVADAKFVKEAAEGGLAEVALGQLAVKKGTSNDVKKFGQRMVDDHSKANDELKQLASQKNVDVPQDLNAKDKATKARLEALSGEQFDQQYMEDMVKDHTKDVSDFRRESKSAHDPDIKKFAAQTLPTLEDHLRQAKTIAPTTMAPSSTR